MLQNDDVNVAYINCIQTVIQLYNIHCPFKKTYVKCISKKKTWITNGLKNACRKGSFTIIDIYESVHSVR